jgi:hypothetical protein
VLDLGDELARASTAQRVATLLLASVFAPGFGLAAWKIAGKVEDLASDAALIGGALVLGLLSVAVGLVAVIAVKPSLSKHSIVVVPIGVILMLVFGCYRLFSPY